MASEMLDALRAETPQGPPRWREAWLRMIAWYEPVWPTQDLTWAGPLLKQGAHAVALGIYLVSGERGGRVDEVEAGDIEDLLVGYGKPEVALWDSKVRACGHDPEDPDDPVSTVWRELRFDRGPADDPFDDLMSTVRSGIVLSDAIRQTLGDRRNWAEKQNQNR